MDAREDRLHEDGKPRVLARPRTGPVRASVRLRHLSLRHARRRLRRLAARARTSFPGEIADDELAAQLAAVAADPDVSTILEIGSATGDGSTRALVEGAGRRVEPPAIHCLEVDRSRWDELARRYADTPFVHAHHGSSVGPDAYASEAEVRGFYAAVPSTLNAFPLEQVLGWRSAELARLGEPGLVVDGIERIRRDHGVQRFDAVLLDGSEFTARAELELVYGARYVLLDDTSSFKNHGNCLRLLADPGYELVASNPALRNGYAVFRARAPDRPS